MFAVLAALFATAALFVAGCSSSSKPSEPLPEAAERIRKVASDIVAVKRLSSFSRA